MLGFILNQHIEGWREDEAEDEAEVRDWKRQIKELKRDFISWLKQTLLKHVWVFLARLSVSNPIGKPTTQLEVKPSALVQHLCLVSTGFWFFSLFDPHANASR